MNRRLSAIASLIRSGRGVIDVGTDHGYLPIFLCRNGYGGRIIATDINAAPLASARKNAEDSGFQERISFILSDGIASFSGSEADTIVIAGMGGDTICGILDRGEGHIAPDCTLILQPMTKQEVLRYWLIHNGYAIEREMLVSDGAVYQFFTARFGDYVRCSDAELFTGKYELACRNELFPEQLERLIKRYGFELQAMENAPRDSARASVLRSVLDGLCEMRSRNGNTD